MTVREIFELRKQGRIEEAYEAIRPMYAVHQGKYTTLCMFWTASDILKKRVKEQRYDEAEKIFKALLRVLPKIEDKEGRARNSILYAAVTLYKESKTFSMLDFVGRLNGLTSLTPGPGLTLGPGLTPGLGLTPGPSPEGEGECEGEGEWRGEGECRGEGKFGFPPVAMQLLECAFRQLEELREQRGVSGREDEELLANCLKVMPLLQEAVRCRPGDKDIKRYMDVVYSIMGEE